MKSLRASLPGVTLLYLIAVAVVPACAEDWTQFKFDARHSGNATHRHVETPLGLVAAVPMTDAIYTAPVVAEGRVYVVDGAGVAACIDPDAGKVIWKFESAGGKGNCNNVSSPAIAGEYLHFGTMAGRYYVLNRENGRLVTELAVGDPIFSTPVVGKDRVYFATLGSIVYAMTQDGTVQWTWDYVREHLGFEGDRWSGADWAKHQTGRVRGESIFHCSRNLALHENTLVIPAGASVVWLKDTGDKAQVQSIFDSRPSTPTLGMSLGLDGTVYRQWHFLDNRGDVERLRLIEDKVEKMDSIPGTESSISNWSLLSFSSVSLRGNDVYRTRPQAGFGFCRHRPDSSEPAQLGGCASVAAPILAGDHGVYGGLDGRLYVAPLSGDGEAWSFATAFGKAISAPAAVCDGRVYFGCEDGYLYILGPTGKRELPEQPLVLEEIRTPLTGPKAGEEWNRFTNFEDWANSNYDDQETSPPFRIRWIRRYEGSTKHYSTFGGGRMYTHTAEGQIFAVEQTTGRQLWRNFYPDVYICYTAPLYFEGKLLVPQAGFKGCQLRCLDAATGDLIWQAPFSGSPSWNRQMPPIVHNGLAFYMFSTGIYGPDEPEEPPIRRKRWLFSSYRAFPSHHKPMLRAFDMQTGKVAWERDFSNHGQGGDSSGICLLDGTLYYSCHFGMQAKRRGESGPSGLTMALRPETGETIWETTDFYLGSGCTISGSEGKLFLGGYFPTASHSKVTTVTCLDAGTGSLLWMTKPLECAIHVVTVRPDFAFAHVQRKECYFIDKETGKFMGVADLGYKCTRYSFSGPYMLASNMDILDSSDISDIKLISTGPAIDPSECTASVMSNGRMYYTGHGCGLQVSLVTGAEAANLAPWETATDQRER